MGQLSAKLRNAAGGKVTYFCQGCDMPHQVRVRQEEPGPVWGWDGNVDAPTFTPSVLVTYDHMSEAGRERGQAFRAQHGRDPTREELPYDEHHVCHTFIRAGMVQFLSDCTHGLAGQTLPLPDLPDWLQDQPATRAP